jgi:hypothetical protein
VPQVEKATSSFILDCCRLFKNPTKYTDKLCLNLLLVTWSNRISPIVYSGICAFLCLSKKSNRSGIFKLAAHSRNLHVEGMVWS